jgi:general secretion pathway protein A
MYESFFGLAEKPFAITPDPRYLYLSERHSEALAHLLYGIDDAGGFIQLTGEVGTGKTTMLRSLLAELPAHVDIALILNPRVTPEEFLLGICEELRVDRPAIDDPSIKASVDALNRYLLDAHAKGRRVVVIVDEAQQLAADVLEQVRLLTNLETATTKLLQIILVGQPELREVLGRNDLRQLAQRITGRYHLEPLSAADTAAYVRHRLRVAGASGEVFDARALAALHRLSGGVPRLINVIGDRALLAAYTRESRVVTSALVRAAAREIGGERRRQRTRASVTVAVAIVTGIALVAGWTASHRPVADDPAESATARRPAGAPPATSTPPQPAPLADLATFVAQHPDKTGTDVAMARLLGLWGQHVEADGGKPCEQAVAAGLACETGHGSLAELRRFDRPAVLTLVMPDGTAHQVVVSALDDRHARIEAGDESLNTDLLDLSRFWFGEYLLLWRPPVVPPQSLHPGFRGEAVRWLRARVPGIEASGGRDPDLYDRPLARAIEQFQKSQRLDIDGIAGTRTQLLLDTLTHDTHVPTLRPGAR